MGSFFAEQVARPAKTRVDGRLAALEDETMKGDGKFGYVDHMVSEHRRLDQLLRRTLATVPSWEELDAEDWLPRVRSGLVAIQTELAHHFRDEEQGGCLEEAVARCPQLSADVQKIEAQHDDLLARLSELIDRCQCCGKVKPQQAHCLEQELRQIVRELRIHEALENRIMQQGFNVCVESEDLADRPAVEPVRVETARQPLAMGARPGVV